MQYLYMKPILKKTLPFFIFCLSLANASEDLNTDKFSEEESASFLVSIENELGALNDHNGNYNACYDEICGYITSAKLLLKKIQEEKQKGEEKNQKTIDSLTKEWVITKEEIQKTIEGIKANQQKQFNAPINFSQKIDADTIHNLNCPPKKHVKVNKRAIDLDNEPDDF